MMASDGIAPPPETERTYSAQDLLDGAQTAKIVLDDQTYTLRLTRARKLILTK